MSHFILWHGCSKLKKILTEKVVSFLAQQMNKDRIKYNDFYKDYSLYFKEGVVLEQDMGIKVRLSAAS